VTEQRSTGLEKPVARPPLAIYCEYGSAAGKMVAAAGRAASSETGTEMILNHATGGFRLPNQ
jgi:hypothetical protein